MQHSMKNLRSLVLCAVIVFGVTLLKQTEAKRGCSSFGHSCFGGHGKRSELDSSGAGQEEVAQPRPVYPPQQQQTLGEMLAADDIIPIRNGGFNDNGDDADMEQLKLRLSPYLKHWLMAYRKSQENKNAYPYNLI